MTYEERAGIRMLISTRRREIVGLPICPIGRGSERGYSMGCRCPGCREAASDRRRERGRRQSEREGRRPYHSIVQ